MGNWMFDEGQKNNEVSSELSVALKLGIDRRSANRLFVETTDVNGKTLEGPVPLEVIVIDQNDNRPIFREGPYIGHVMEGSPTGTTVMRMTAFDADDPATDNALLRYNIRQQTPDKPSPNMFYIDPEKGDIVTVVSPALLDREVRRHKLVTPGPQSVHTLALWFCPGCFKVFTCFPLQSPWTFCKDHLRW
nr:PREDICTED: cadherin-13-like [Equus przewalskii]